MSVVFDNIIFDLQKSGGISVVWFELLERLQKIGSFDIYFRDNEVSENHFRKQLHIDSSKVIAPNKCPMFTRYMPVRIPLQTAFVFHSSYYRYCLNPAALNVTTVHDFTYEFCKKGFSKAIHSWQKFEAIRHSDFIVCVSENTKKDLMNFLPDIDEEKLRVIYNGVSEDYSVIENIHQIETCVTFAPKSYVLYVGDRSEYKNFKLCVQAVAHTDYNLVVVGKCLTDKERAFVSLHLPPSRILDTGYVNNCELNKLYNQAAVLIYPSAYEGFGIPVLEAQRAGCPVIAYNTSAIPEVMGSTTLLMKTLTEEEMLNKIKMLKNTDIIRRVIDLGLVFSRKFSWDNMAKGYAKLYKEAINKGVEKCRL